MATRSLLGRVSMALALLSLGCPLDIDALRVAAARDAGTETPMATPPDAALSDAAVEPARDAAAAEDAGPLPECGVIGAACCMPENTCDVGACLRGRCTAYAGSYSQGCDGSCSERNPYTAGCTCARGFSPFEVDTSEGDPVCDSSWSLCATPTTHRSNFAGAYALLLNDQCEQVCHSTGNMVSECSCPAGARAVRVRWDATCGESEVGVCLRDAADSVDLEVHVRDPDGACVDVNSATGVCECSEGFIAQHTELAGLTVTTCSP